MAGRITNNTYEFDAVATEINSERDIISRTEICQMLKKRGVVIQRAKDVAARLESAGWQRYAGKVRDKEAYAVFYIAPSCALKVAQKYCTPQGVTAKSLFEYLPGMKLRLITNGKINTPQDEAGAPQDCRFRDWSIVEAKGQVQRSTQQLTDQCCDELEERGIIDSDDIRSAMKTHGLVSTSKATTRSRRMIIITRMHRRGFVTWRAGEAYAFASAATSKQDVAAFYAKKNLQTNDLRLADENPAKKKVRTPEEQPISASTLACNELMAAIMRYRDYCRAYA